MYDGTDVAFVLGGLLSAGLAALLLFSAVISLGFFVARKLRDETATAWISLKLAEFFAVTAVLCGMSIPSGFAIYDLFEHQRGYANPPSHVLAVAIASVWGTVAAGMLGIYRLRRKKGSREANQTGPNPALLLPAAGKNFAFNASSAVAAGERKR